MLPVVPNVPIGIIADHKFEGQETVISPQTTIFLYTDGLTEAEDASHQQFGRKRVFKVAEVMKEGKQDARKYVKLLLKSTVYARISYTSIFWSRSMKGHLKNTWMMNSKKVRVLY